MPSRARLDWVQWDPRGEGEWQAALDGQDAVVHLAGEPAAGRRYTDAARKEIRESRVLSTERIVEAIAQAAHPPHTFVCGSAVGYYGSRESDEPLDESAAPGRDFLAQVCVEWERAARRAESSGARVAMLRIGIVLGRDGGALERLVGLFKAFVGGRIGSGRQIMPWIHLDDVVGACFHVLGDPALSGPINTVAPNAVSNAELTRTLARVLGRPALIPAPSFALRALFGEGAEPLLGGQRAIPRALLDHHYTFRFTDLEPALRDLLEPAHR
jgi:uncharacterized protein (TIGR01777 family)